MAISIYQLVEMASPWFVLGAICWAAFSNADKLSDHPIIWLIALALPISAWTAAFFLSIF